MIAKTSKLSKGEKILLIVIVLFMGIMTAIIGMLQVTCALPTAAIPAPVMPSPNARDYYLSALHSFIPYQMATAAGPYSLTFSYIGQRRNISPLGNKSWANPEPSLADLQGLVRANAPAFSMLRTGFNYEFREFPCRSFSTIYPAIYLYFDLVRNVNIAAQVKQLSGDWNGAANDSLDAIHLGEDIPRGAPLTGLLVGIRVQEDGRAGVWRTIDHLNAAQARAAARRLEEIIHHHTPLSAVLLEEKWGKQAALLALLRKSDWRIDLHDAMVDGRPISMAYAFSTSKTQIFNEYTRYVDAWIARAKLPYAFGKADPPLPQYSFVCAHVRGYAGADLRDARNETQNHLLTVSFALRAYDLEHGGYPSTLAQLTPSYLKEISTDPFGGGEALHYKRTGKSYLLYSAGLNGKDDHGTGDDIVAGVTMQ